MRRIRVIRGAKEDTAFLEKVEHIAKAGAAKKLHLFVTEALYDLYGIRESLPRGVGNKIDPARKKLKGGEDPLHYLDLVQDCLICLVDVVDDIEMMSAESEVDRYRPPSVYPTRTPHPLPSVDEADGVDDLTREEAAYLTGDPLRWR